jgi:SH3-like domain-containing protein
MLKFIRLAFASLIGATLCMASLPLRAQQMVSITTPETNMRAGAGTKYEVTWILGVGYPLKVVARSGKWLKVQDFEGDVGWVYQPLTNRIPHHVIKVREANLRAQPSLGSRILGKAVYGEIVRTLEKRTQWVRVQRDTGLKGWIARNLLWGW